MEKVTELLKKKGNWWFDPWWEEDRWYASSHIEKDKLLDSIDFLKSIFPKEWIKSLGDEPLFHPFLQLLFFGKGLSQINSIYFLAERIRLIVKIDGYVSVLNNYKTIAQAKSANLEMFFAEVMSTVGGKVSFIPAKPKKGRTPDLLIDIEGKEFVVECKCIQDSEFEKWMQNYSRDFSCAIMDAIPADYDVFYFHPRFNIEPEDVGHPDLFSFRLAAILDVLPIVNQLKAICPFSPKYSYIDMGFKGSLCLFPKNDQINSRIEMPEVPQDFIGRRLVGSAIIKANQQIAEFGKPGIVVVSYGYPPELGALKMIVPRLFEQRRDEYSLLMGVLIFPMQNMLRYVRPIWVANPFSVFSVEDFGLPELLERVLDPYM